MKTRDYGRHRWKIIFLSQKHIFYRKKNFPVSVYISNLPQCWQKKLSFTLELYMHIACALDKADSIALIKLFSDLNVFGEEIYRKQNRESKWRFISVKRIIAQSRDRNLTL